jgi:hypothetical protein
MLCEAIAMDPQALGLARPGSGSNDEASIAEVARRRRAVWPDRATACASYSSRPPFDVLAPEALEAYARWGFHDRPDGQVELACTPLTEAALFELPMERGPLPAFEHLGSMHAAPVILYGDSTDLPVEFFRAQAERAGAPLVVVDGGHLFLQEDTARAEDLVREHLTRR